MTTATATLAEKQEEFRKANFAYITPATRPQVDYIRTLIAERPNSPTTRQLRGTKPCELTKDQASHIITQLLTEPKEAAMPQQGLRGRMLTEGEAQAYETRRTARPLPKPAAPAAISAEHLPEKGTYTVVQGDTRHTIRFARKEEEAGNFFSGKIVISFLTGPDNESDYQGFAHIDEDENRVKVWARFRSNTALLEAVGYLASSPEAKAAAGEAYALESGNCYRCNRMLTVPASISRGLGPTCQEAVEG